MVPVTRIVHECLAPCLNPGDKVIDATCGNGHDTAFLAERVGPNGNVLACDVQRLAIQQAKRLCERYSNITFVEADHAQQLAAWLEHFQEQITAVMFNLGYLPGSDKTVITTPENTKPAMLAAWKLLRPGGVLSVIAYVGHPGGSDEDLAVGQTLKQFVAADAGQWLISPNENAPPHQPKPYVVQKAKRTDLSK